MLGGPNRSSTVGHPMMPLYTKNPANISLSPSIYSGGWRRRTHISLSAQRNHETGKDAHSIITTGWEEAECRVYHWRYYLRISLSLLVLALCHTIIFPPSSP